MFRSAILQLINNCKEYFSKKISFSKELCVSLQKENNIKKHILWQLNLKLQE